MDQWKSIWEESHTLRTPFERRWSLNRLLKAPWPEVLRLARKGRKRMSRSARLPDRECSKRFYYAGSWRKNVMTDVVSLYVTQTRRRLRIDQILICPTVRVGLVPNYYLIREEVRAAAGTIGGGKVVHFDEFLCGRTLDELLFVDEFEAGLPQFKEFRYRGTLVKCHWTSRGLSLKSWQRRLRVQTVEDLREALRGLSDQLSFVRLTEEVREEVRNAFRDRWTELSEHSDEIVRLMAVRLCNLYR